MKCRNVLAVLIMAFASFVFANGVEELSPEEIQYQSWAKNVWDWLDRRTGEIVISEAGATLNVPEEFYYLNAADAEKVLVDVWGNPSSHGTLGIGLLLKRLFSRVKGQ